MRNTQIWALAQLLLSGAVSGREKRADCPAPVTITVFQPITFYVTGPTTLTTPRTKPNGGDGTKTAASYTEGYSQVSSATSSKCNESGTGTGLPATSSLQVTAVAPPGLPGTSTTFVISVSPTSVEAPTGVSTSATVTSEIATSAATSALTASEVAPSSVVTSEIAPSSVVTSEVAPSSAATSEVATTAVTSDIPAPSSGGGEPPSPPGPFQGFTNAVYFTNWGIYGANYQPQELPVSELTHILYAFADIGADGTVKTSDSYADVEKHYPGDSWLDFGHNAYGVVKQLYLHKKHNRNLKTLLSVGGWTYSPKFVGVAATAAGRQTFARSALQLMVDYGFDGVDLDWEYPATTDQAQDFVLLVQALRAALDGYADEHDLDYHFLITIASPAGPTNYAMMKLKEMDQYVDSWHLMAYDYAGSWDPTTGHQSNLFKNTALPASTKFDTDDAVRYYEGQGIAARKIIVGLPLYGRSFEATTGLGAQYAGVGTGGPQPGVWLYSSLPRPGAVELWDDVAKASWSYDAGARELVSYDTPRSVVAKTGYVQANGLGGTFFWEASGDRAGAQSLVSSASKDLRWLDDSPNNLRYPTSQYDNIRIGMPGL